MNLEAAIQAFASARHDLPREAMQWVLDHWDAVAPELLSVVERYTSGADRSDEAARAVFFIAHLAGEKQDPRVFPRLCRLGKDHEALEAVFVEDTVATTFRELLITTFDGHLDTLKGLIEAAEAHEFARTGALNALAYLTATGRIAREVTKAYLRELYATMQPQEENAVWWGWAKSIALLGLEGLSDIVRQAFARDLIEPRAMNYDQFCEWLERTLSDPERMAGFRADYLGPFENGIGKLSAWYAIAKEAKRD